MRSDSSDHSTMTMRVSGRSDEGAAFGCGLGDTCSHSALRMVVRRCRGVREPPPIDALIVEVRCGCKAVAGRVETDSDATEDMTMAKGTRGGGSRGGDSKGGGCKGQQRLEG